MRTFLRVVAVGLVAFLGSPRTALADGVRQTLSLFRQLHREGRLEAFS